jgi:hypothetical protein
MSIQARKSGFRAQKTESSLEPDSIVDEKNVERRISLIHEKLRALSEESQLSRLANSLLLLARNFDSIKREHQRVQQAMDGVSGEPFEALGKLTMAPEPLVLTSEGIIKGSNQIISTLAEAFVRSVTILEGLYSLVQSSVWKKFNPFHFEHTSDPNNDEHGGKAVAEANANVAKSLSLQIPALCNSGSISQANRKNETLIELPQVQLEYHTLANSSIMNLYPLHPLLEPVLGPSQIDLKVRVRVPISFGVLVVFKQLYWERLYKKVNELEATDSKEVFRLEDMLYSALKRLPPHLTTEEFRVFEHVTHSNFRLSLSQIEGPFGICERWENELSKVEMPTQFEVKTKLTELVKEHGWKVIAETSRENFQLKSVAYSTWNKWFSAAGLSGLHTTKAWEKQRRKTQAKKAQA